MAITEIFFDVIVLGIGGMGSSACWSLANRGVKVLGLEQFSMAHDRGSSHGDRRLIRQAYFEHSDYVPLLKQAYKYWEAISSESGENLFHRNGLVMVGGQESETLKGAWQSAALHKIPVEKLSRGDLEKNYPHFEIPDGFSGLLEPAAGYLEIEKGVKAFCTAALSRGAKLHFEEVVRDWKVDSDSVVVSTEKAQYRAKKLVITAGPWSSRLLANLNVPFEVRRVPQFWFDCPKDAKISDQSPCFAFDMPEGFFYGFPPDQGRLKMAEHRPLEKVSEPSLLNREIKDSDFAPLVHFASRCLPGILSKPVKGSVCMYTMTPDGHFVIDRHPQNNNVVFAGGFSGHGYKFASVVGPILADLALDGKTKEPIDFLKLGRFHS